MLLKRGLRSSGPSLLIFEHDNVLYHAQTLAYAAGMEFDKDLAREILLKVEADPHFNGSFRGVSAGNLGIACSPETFAYHCVLLHEAGFLEGNMKMAQQGHIVISRLTFKGHEFLDTIRDGEIWRLTKETAAKTGAASVQALLAIATAAIKQKLAEHGIPL
jgi:hypothetical protein